MKCPNCSVAFSASLDVTETWLDRPIRKSAGGIPFGHRVATCHCPECGQFVALLEHGLSIVVASEYGIDEGYSLQDVLSSTLIYPASVKRDLALEVPERFAADYREACAVLPISPKASAAISRRLLQDILREHFKIKKRDLSQEIEVFIALKDTPTHLANAVDAVRNVGNFAAHPIKDSSTGTVVDVEPGEAEWLLDVLEAMFDFAFVQPVRLRNQRDKLNAKLQSLGKDPIKTPKP